MSRQSSWGLWHRTPSCWQAKDTVGAESLFRGQQALYTVEEASVNFRCIKT